MSKRRVIPLIMVLVLLFSLSLTIAEVSEEEIAKVEDLSETAIKKTGGRMARVQMGSHSDI